MLANTTATIYNKSVDYNTDAVVYNRTVLPAVHWEDGISSAAKGKSRAEDRPVFVSIDFIVASPHNRSVQVLDTGYRRHPPEGHCRGRDTGQRNQAMASSTSTGHIHHGARNTRPWQ